MLEGIDEIGTTERFTSLLEVAGHGPIRLLY